jgi:group I intron endonuclease
MNTVYQIKNVQNGKRYVGVTDKSVPTRWAGHRRTSRRKGAGYHLHSAIRKYGPDAFEVSRLAWVATRSGANDLEKYFIALFRTYDSRYGYNLTMGGQGGTPTAETRRKISAARIGKTRGPLPEEWRRNIGAGLKASPLYQAAMEEQRSINTERLRRLSAARKGKPGRRHTEESRRRISEANGARLRLLNESRRGKRLSNEHCQKMSDARKGKAMPTLRGKSLSEEHRRKISEANNGRVHSQETRKRISEARKNSPLCKQRSMEALKAARRGIHIHWHEKRGVANPNCEFCGAELARAA